MFTIENIHLDITNYKKNKKERRRENQKDKFNLKRNLQVNLLFKQDTTKNLSKSITNK